jgi:hypothetical protein
MVITAIPNAIANMETPVRVVSDLADSERLRSNLEEMKLETPISVCLLDDYFSN